jgi:hypothetical protein
VGKYLFTREISWISPVRRLGRADAGRPKAAGTGRAQADSKCCLEHSPEKAGAAAQQTAQETTENISAEHTAEGTAPDRRIAETTFAANVRIGHHVADRPDDVETATNEAVVTRVGKAGDHVAELIVASQDATLMTEDAAFAVEEAADDTAEQPAVDSAEETADRAGCLGVSRDEACCAKAQTEREAGCAYSPYRRCQLSSPFSRSLLMNCPALPSRGQ